MNTDKHETEPRSGRSEEAHLNSGITHHALRTTHQVCSFALLLGLSLLTSAATGGESNIVATVAGSTITTEKVKSTMARGGFNVFEIESARRALDENINNELLAAAAKKQGFEQRPEVAERTKQLLIESYVAEKVDQPLQGVTPSDDDLKSYYEAHKSEFSQPALARGQIITILITSGKEADAISRAGEALSAIKSGKTFEDVTGLFSDDPSERMSRGASAWFTSGKSNRRYPDEVNAALFAGKVGEVSGPIKTPRAFYLVKTTEKRPEIVRAFAEVKPGIARAVLLTKRQAAFAALCSDLRKEFPVKVNEAALTNVVEKSTPNGGPPSGPVDLK